MPVRPDASPSASPDVAASTSGVDRSSALINSAAASCRRHTSDSCPNGDSHIPNEDKSSSSGMQDENDRSRLRPSSLALQSSSLSSLKVEDEATSDVDSSRQRQPLPSLSSGSAALLQLREHQRSSNINVSSPSGCNSIRVSTLKVDTLMQKKLPLQSGANAGGASPTPLTSFHRREEEGNPLIPDEDINEEKDDIVDDVEDDDPSASPLPNDQRDVRIMFHGREIFAEDLIGLRVGKTFAGHGRLLGQVVKFDKSVALYTVVYADGDAEDLTVDNTLRILIQDEIERADPSQPPPAISLLFKKGEDGLSPASPDTGDFMTPPAPLQRQISTSQRRARIQVSEREAQFVISLFENHALPTLVRQGWRVQTSSSGRSEARFVSVNGEIFQSALDVVGHIALNDELLTSCFPANVHSAILSLLPREAAVSTTAFTDSGSNHGSTGSAPRKRTTSDSPSAEHFDSKRTRQVRDEAYRGVGVPMRAAVVRGSDIMQYRHEDMDRRAEAANRISAYRGQGMDGRIRVSGDRFIGGEITNETRIQAPPALRGYRRTSSRDPTMENPFSSKWFGTESVPGRVESAEYSRRFVNTPEWRERGDAFALDRHLEVHCCNRICTESRYIHRSSSRTPADAEGSASVTATGTPTGFYRDSTGSPCGSQASPMTNSFAYPQYSTLRAKVSTNNRTSATPRVSRETASFMSPTDTLGASAAFSMVDFDRMSKSRPGSAHAE